MNYFYDLLIKFFTLVVKIKPNQFLKAGENLLIYHGGLVCLNRLTISIKKS